MALANGAIDNTRAYFPYSTVPILATVLIIASPKIMEAPLEKRSQRISLKCLLLRPRRIGRNSLKDLPANKASFSIWRYCPHASGTPKRLPESPSIAGGLSSAWSRCGRIGSAAGRPGQWPWPLRVAPGSI